MDLWSNFITNCNHRIIDKWTHYFPIYERYFSQWKNKSLTFLEIGIFKGGSLEMWRNYFSPLAKIVSIDIDPECAKQESYGTFVRIGDQSDPKFLQSIIDEFGVPDIVLDDGSHQQEHILTSFQFFYPKMHKNAIYMVEDLHTAYWEEYGGGEGNVSFMEFAKNCTDKINACWSRGKIDIDYISEQTLGISFYDSIVVFEKGDVWLKNSIMLTPNNAFWENLRGKKIYVYGAGVYGQFAKDLLKIKGLTFAGFIDSNYAGAQNPEVLLSNKLESNTHILIASPKYAEEMRQNCLDHLLKENEQFSIIGIAN